MKSEIGGVKKVGREKVHRGFLKHRNILRFRFFTKHLVKKLKILN